MINRDEVEKQLGSERFEEVEKLIQMEVHRLNSQHPKTQ